MAVSRTQAESAPVGVQIAGVVPNPIAVERWPLRTEKQDYLLWVGRMDADKGPHRDRGGASDGPEPGARRAVQPGQEEYFRE